MHPLNHLILYHRILEFDDFRGVFVPNRMLRFVYQDWEVKHEQHPSEKDKDREIKQEKDRDQTRLFCKAVVRRVGTLGQCNAALHFPTIHLPTSHFTVIII